MIEQQSKPLVSIIIPTYRRSDYLLRAIESLKRQSYDKIEIIVVDDNPPDSKYRSQTKIKLKEYIENKEIVYLKNDANVGGALARNNGIRVAKGEYITFLDDDDIYLKNKVESQLNYMIRNNLDLSFTNVAIVNNTGNLVDFRQHHNYVKNNQTNNDLLRAHLKYHLTPTGTYMFRKEAIERINYFDNANVGQEFRLMLKSIISGLNIGYLNETQVVQVIHDRERISIGPNKIRGEKQIYELKHQYFDQLNFWEKQYIRFRYRAVLAVVGFRSRKLIFSIYNLILAFMLSPYHFVKEFINLNKKIYDNEQFMKLAKEQIEELLRVE